MDKLKKSTWFYIIAALVFVLTFLVILPRLCHRQIYSPYFSAPENDPWFIETYNQQNSRRIEEAKQYISSVNKNNVTYPKSGSSLTIVIVTAGERQISNMKSLGINIGAASKRWINSLEYLTQTSASLHKILLTQKVPFAVKNVFVCDVSPSSQNSSELKTVGKIVNIIHKHHLKHPRQIVTSMRQQLEDYAFCFAQSALYDSKFVLLFEDDAVLRDNFFHVLHSKLSKLENKIVRGEPRRLNLGQIRLYLPDKYTGFTYNTVTVLELGFVGLLSLSVTYMLTRLVSQKPPSATLLVLGVVYGVLLAWSIGRPYLLQAAGRHLGWYRSFTAGQECCLQAVLLPSTVAADLAQFLENLPDRNAHADIIMNDFITDKGLESYLVVPNLVSHVGLLSTLNNRAKHPAHFIDV